MNNNKLLALLISVMIFSSAAAQTEQGRMFVGANSNFNFNNYSNDGNGFNTINLNGQFGYFLADNIAGGLNLDYLSYDGESAIGFGFFGRYYLMESKLFLQGGLDLGDQMYWEDVTAIGLAGGYVIWVNDNVTVQPSLKYTMLSVDGENAGNSLDINVGFGVYF